MKSQKVEYGVYILGDIYSVSKTINLCNDILESKDESASQLSVKLWVDIQFSDSREVSNDFPPVLLRSCI